MTRCDRCLKRTYAKIRVDGDWRTFCYRCFLAAGYEPAQPIRPSSRREYYSN